MPESLRELSRCAPSARQDEAFARRRAQRGDSARSRQFRCGWPRDARAGTERSSGRPVSADRPPARVAVRDARRAAGPGAERASCRRAPRCASSRPRRSPSACRSSRSSA
jgi:hypothetical protein